MAVSSTLSADGKLLIIEAEGRFDASSLDDFRKCYENVTEDPPQAYVVDLKNAVYLDSSALGMLLVLRDFAGGEGANIAIRNCSPEVKKIFAISSFDQLFTIR